jgi:hypothetical protein
MKQRGTLKTGDIVCHKYDIKDNLQCFGTVIEISDVEALVMWSSESTPLGWYKSEMLKIMFEKSS